MRQLLVECVTWPCLKFEIENIKEQITQLTNIPTTTFISSSDDVQSFRKRSKKNAHVTRKNRNNIFPRDVCHYYGEKGHVWPICHIR